MFELKAATILKVELRLERTAIIGNQMLLYVFVLLQLINTLKLFVGYRC